MRVAWLKDLRMADLEQVGGKNASLGEMIGNLAAAGIRVPGGFATTAQAYREFLGELGPRIDERLRALNPEDVDALAKCGAEVRSWISSRPSRSRLSKRYVLNIKSLRRTLQAMPRSPCAPRRRPRICPMRPSPASRKPSSTSAAPTTCLRRSAMCTPRSITTGRSPTARTTDSIARERRDFRGGPADGAQRPRRKRRHVHARHGVRLPRRGVHHFVVRSGRACSCRAR